MLMPHPHQRTDHPNTEAFELSDIIGQMRLTEIYRKLHANTVEYTLSADHGVFSKIDHLIE